MPSETVQLDWISDQSFLLHDRSGFPVIMTQPMGVNGADLLPLSLIGCAAWDLIAILQKQRQQVSKLKVIAESERDKEPPWRYRKIHVRYILTGKKPGSEKGAARHRAERNPILLHLCHLKAGG